MGPSPARHGAPAGRLVASLAAASLAAAVLAAQSTPQQKPAPFQTGVNFVRVDVYPTAADGRHVADLTAADFEILENGAPQKIETFEHVVIASGSATAADRRVDPDSTRTEKQLAADPRNRLFVLFLDTNHVTDTVLLADDPTVGGRLPAPQRRDGPPMPIVTALTNFIEKVVGPDDLVALITPDMDPREMVFVRRPSSIQDFLEGPWARRDAPVRGNADEQRLRRCGLSEELILRRREEQTLRAARDLVAHLRGVRDERKAVLLVSEGWMLYRPDPSLAPKAPPGPKGIYVGPDGKPRMGMDTRDSTIDMEECRREASRLWQIDDERDFRDLLDEANRANVTFYPIDPRGLAAANRMAGGVLQTEKVPRGKDPGLDGIRDTLGGSGLTPQQVEALLEGSVVLDAAALKIRLEAMHTLAAATDGLTLLSNDLGRVLQRIADDLSAYYLLGYSSTNTKADGSFRRITVRVTRPGVTVRARRGYRAATPEELAASRTAPAIEDPVVEPVRNAVAALPVLHDSVPFAIDAGRGCGGAGFDAASGRGVWVAGEITAAGIRDTGWQSGATIEVSVADTAGRAIGAARGALQPADHAVVVTVATAAAQDADRVEIVARPGVASAPPVRQTLRLPAGSSAADTPLCAGTAMLARRGPFTGNAFQPTADARFRRQERVRVEVPVGGPLQSFAATLLDRAGKPIAIPMTPGDRTDGSGWRWVGGEMALAPLAAGDYVVQIEVVGAAARHKVLRAFRVIP